MTVHFSLQNAAVIYRQATQHKRVLSNLNLDIKQGEWLCLVGRNGSGKSTLGLVIAGLVPISKGKATNHLDASHTAVQMIFQNPDAKMIGETTYDDMRFSVDVLGLSQSEADRRIDETLRTFGIEHLAKRRITTLSGGQKQLVNIASSVVMDPSFVIFDESTSMLDPASREQVIAAAQILHRQGKTIVWITQWMDEVVFADRIMALSDGKIFGFYTPEEFFYQSTASDATPCAALGFEPPYPVQVAKHLHSCGVAIGRPLTVDRLTEAVHAACQL